MKTFSMVIILSIVAYVAYLFVYVPSAERATKDKEEKDKAAASDQEVKDKASCYLSNPMNMGACN